MLPLTAGFLIAGPSRSAVRPLRCPTRSPPAACCWPPSPSSSSTSCRSTSATGLRHPALLIGLSHGLFIAPEPDGIMNSLPAEQRGAGAGWPHLPVLGPGAVDRDLLHPHDPWPVPALPGTCTRGVAHGCGAARHPGLSPAPCGQPLRRLPRLQPDEARCSGRHPAPPAAAKVAFLDGPLVLPPASSPARSSRASMRRSTSPPVPASSGR